MEADVTACRDMLDAHACGGVHVGIRTVSHAPRLVGPAADADMTRRRADMSVRTLCCVLPALRGAASAPQKVLRNNVQKTSL